MKENPVPENEDRRLEELASLNILDTPPEQIFDDLTELAAYICDTPVSLISLIDKERQWFKSKYNWDQDFTRRTISFCQYTIMFDDIFEIEDAADDDILADNPLVKEEPGIRYYAGVPLISSDEFALGSICVIDFKPSRLNDFQRKALKILGRQVSNLIQMRKKGMDLEQRHRRLQLRHQNWLNLHRETMAEIASLSSRGQGAEMAAIHRLAALAGKYQVATPGSAPKSLDVKKELTALVKQFGESAAEAINYKVAFGHRVPEKLRFHPGELQNMLAIMFSPHNSADDEVLLGVESQWESRGACSLEFWITTDGPPSGPTAQLEARLRDQLMDELLEEWSGNYSESHENGKFNQSLVIQFPLGD